MSDQRPTPEIMRDISALFDELAENMEREQQSPRTPRSAAVEKQRTDPSVAELQTMVDGNAQKGGKPGRTTQLTAEVFEQSLPQAIAIARRIIAGIGANHANLKSGLTGQLAIQHIPYDTKLIDEALKAAKRPAPEDDDEPV